MEVSIEDRVRDLENHARGDPQKNGSWGAIAFGSFAVTVGLFIALATTNGVHDHFFSFSYQDDGDFIKVYDKRIEHEGYYALAIILGVMVALTQKIVTIPGERIMHGLLEDNDAGFFQWLKIALYETAGVIMAMLTTFLYFTNVAILLCVLLGRLLGLFVVYTYFYPQKTKPKVSQAMVQHNPMYEGSEGSTSLLF